MKNFNQSPLPFQGQKRRFQTSFKEALKGFKDAPVFVDLFGGSGSTMAACHNLNRKNFTMELEPKYCQVIVDRMRKLDPTLTIKRNGNAI